MAKVRVKLFADCHVGGKLRKKDEEVSISEEIAADFGATVPKEETEKEPKPKKAEK